MRPVVARIASTHPSRRAWAALLAIALTVLASLSRPLTPLLAGGCASIVRNLSTPCIPMATALAAHPNRTKQFYAFDLGFLFLFFFSVHGAIG